MEQYLSLSFQNKHGCHHRHWGPPPKLGIDWHYGLANDILTDSCMPWRSPEALLWFVMLWKVRSSNPPRGVNEALQLVLWVITPFGHSKAGTVRWTEFWQSRQEKSFKLRGSPTLCTRWFASLAVFPCLSQLLYLYFLWQTLLRMVLILGLNGARCYFISVDKPPG